MNTRMLILAAVLSAACVESDERTPCSTEGRCLPGFRCIEGLCQSCDEVDCEDAPMGGIGPEGGKVCGTDVNPACIDVPANALSVPVQLRVSRTGGVFSAPGLAAVADAIYSVEPAATEFAVGAVVEIPISTAMPQGVAVYRGDTINGPWSRLQSIASPVLATGSTDRAGFFTAARATGGADAGADDAGN